MNVQTRVDYFDTSCILHKIIHKWDRHRVKVGWKIARKNYSRKDYESINSTK